MAGEPPGGLGAGAEGGGGAPPAHVREGAVRGVLHGEQAHRGGRTKPRDPRPFDTFEGGRVCQTSLVTRQHVKATYSGKTAVSDTFWRTGGV